MKPSEATYNKDYSVAFENLKYGSSLTLNINTGSSEMKITTKLRVSDKVNATPMGRDEYNIN